MAHGFMQSFDSRLNVFSAGTEPAFRVNPQAVEVMAKVGIDIGGHTPHHVSEYLGGRWDYVITVCGGANENCPVFSGRVMHRLHIGFDDPSRAMGTPEFIAGEFRRVRDEIKARFYRLYSEEIKPQLP